MNKRESSSWHFKRCYHHKFLSNITQLDLANETARSVVVLVQHAVARLPHQRRQRRKMYDLIKLKNICPVAFKYLSRARAACRDGGHSARQLRSKGPKMILFRLSRATVSSKRIYIRNHPLGLSSILDTKRATARAFSAFFCSAIIRQQNC